MCSSMTESNHSVVYASASSDLASEIELNAGAACRNEELVVEHTWTSCSKQTDHQLTSRRCEFVCSFRQVVGSAPTIPPRYAVNEARGLRVASHCWHRSELEDRK